MAPMTSTSARARSERGAELIEFALVFPLLLMVVLGIVDFGFLFQRLEVVTNAAREGARIAVLPGYLEADVRARVCNFLLSGGIPVQGTCPTPTNPVINVNMAATIPMPTGMTPLAGSSVEVVYTHQYLFIGPIAGWFGGSFTSVPIRGVAVMRDEVAAGSGS
jgi:hypothetical protein